MLADALRSALKQDCQLPIEIIVVDNDPESTASVLSKLDVGQSLHALRYYVNDVNLGMFGNWNQGILLSRGRWVTILHDDDWLAPNFVSLMLPLVQGGFDFAVCRVEIGVEGFDPDLFLKFPSDSQIASLTIDDLIYGNPSPAPGILLTRELLQEVDGFDPDSYPSGDYLTYSECAIRVPAVRIDRVLAYYRTTDSQTLKGNTMQAMIEQSIRIKKDLLSRASPFSTLTYILSLVFWFRLARECGRPVYGIEIDWRIRCAILLSRSRFMARSLELVRRGAKHINSCLKSSGGRL